MQTPHYVIWIKELIGGEFSLEILICWWHEIKTTSPQQFTSHVFHPSWQKRNSLLFQTKVPFWSDKSVWVQQRKRWRTFSNNGRGGKIKKERSGWWREKNPELHRRPQQLQKIDFDAAQTHTGTGADFVFTLLFLLSLLTHLHVKPTVQHFYEVPRRDGRKEAVLHQPFGNNTPVITQCLAANRCRFGRLLGIVVESTTEWQFFKIKVVII